VEATTNASTFGPAPAVQTKPPGGIRNRVAQAARFEYEGVPLRQLRKQPNEGGATEGASRKARSTGRVPEKAPKVAEKKKSSRSERK
jgi:hypothetical protein